MFVKRERNRMSWKYFEEFNAYGYEWPLWVHIILIMMLFIIIPGLRTDFGGELVWWEPWFLYLFKNDREAEDTEE